MKLQNGFELDGCCSNAMILINNEWTEILIVETSLEVEQARELFENNNTITLVTDTQEITHITNGLVDIKVQDNKSYVWLYFTNSTTRELIQTIKEDVLKLQQEKEDLQLALAETIEQQASDKLELQASMAELIESMNIGGTV